MTSNHTQGPFSLALIGCGRIAQTYLEALSTMPECKLQAVVDVRENAAMSVVGQNGRKAYIDYREVLNGQPVEGVIICTPPNTHAEIATFFLENGVNVLCEKPLSVNSEQAKAMVQKAQEKGRLIMMASKFRYVEDVIKTKAIVESGILGEIIMFENVFCGRVDMRTRWNSDKVAAGGGVLIDNGSHSVDIARYILGPISKVQAEEGKKVQNLPVEDTVRLYFRTESEVMGSVDLSWSIQKEQDSYINIFGTEGVLSVGWKLSRYRQNDATNWITFGNGYDKIAAFSAQIKNFVESIRGNQLPLINGVDGVESVRVIEAAYKSVCMNKWVDVAHE
jgi:predicted dehydrogenase